MNTVLYIYFSLDKNEISWIDLVIIVTILILIVSLILLYRKAHRMKEDMEIAKRSEEVKASFLSHISHALRTPLNTLMVNCDILAEGKGTISQEKQEEIIEEISQSSHHLDEYINELFELSNIEGNVPQLTAIEVNLIELIMSYRREILHDVNKNVLVRIRTELSPHCRAVLDTTMVRQLIMHILQCAAKYTQDGYITIKYNWEREGLRFLIEDTGIGLPKEVCDTLSSKMLDASNDSKMADKTTILSLSVCRAIIDAIHGTIEVSSKQSENGGGTTFNFWFPCEVKNR